MSLFDLGPSYADRAEGGRSLAQALRAYAHRPDVVVLALPRGGLPVGLEVARALDAPLDVLVVRKLGVPGHEELAMGAIASGGIRVVDRTILDELDISEEALARATQEQSGELARREQLYRGRRPPLDLAGKIVVVVDDGLATGSTMRAAVAALRAQKPKRLVVAVPVGSSAARDLLSEEADEVVCLATPEPFFAVGTWYEDFSQTTDEDVSRILSEAERLHEAPRLEEHP